MTSFRHLKMYVINNTFCVIFLGEVQDLQKKNMLNHAHMRYCYELSLTTLLVHK